MLFTPCGLSHAARCQPPQTDNWQTISAADLPNQPRGFLADEHLVQLENWLDTKFSLLGINFRFGLDSTIGLIPGIGDVVTSGLSTLFIADAIKKGARKRTIARMSDNVLIDMTIGAVPLIGDIFDFAFKANTKDLVLLKQEREHLNA